MRRKLCSDRWSEREAWSEHLRSTLIAERREGCKRRPTPKETFTVAPRHRDLIQNLTTEALQADTAQVMVPAGGSFIIVIAKDNHKTGEVQVSAQSRATESTPMRRLATARWTALDADVRGSAIHMLHQGG